ncbi:hypothetical protein [Arthrobacter sp. Helios]|uniref:hypothetical protein n=1 Tax=Arthrobacter sp. Helios TaxID=2828862 RepID=UPI00206B7F1A|nr:hypothetical protein [Arthrobacter sp. Helios]UPO76590.1 hypothetical protein ArtHe_14770 [Arthrobacter sp. Helios]
MPYINLPFLGLNDEKSVHPPAQPPPIPRKEARRAAGTDARRAGPAELVRRVAGALLRRGAIKLLAIKLAASQESLQEQEERQFNLLTYYVNSRSRL